MKPMLCLLCALAVSTGRGDTASLLAKTTTTPVGDWSEIRDAILAEDVSSTGTLAKVIVDSRRDWRERLMANICMEHLSNPGSRDLFFNDPLRDDPERDPDWICTAAGYAHEEIPLFKNGFAKRSFGFQVLKLSPGCKARNPSTPFGERLARSSSKPRPTTFAGSRPGSRNSASASTTAA